MRKIFRRDGVRNDQWNARVADFKCTVNGAFKTAFHTAKFIMQFSRRPVNRNLKPEVAILGEAADKFFRQQKRIGYDDKARAVVVQNVHDVKKFVAQK